MAASYSAGHKPNQFPCSVRSRERGLSLLGQRQTDPGQGRGAQPCDRSNDSLREDSLLHDVGKGVEHALPDMSLQRGVEVGNDLKGG